MARQRDEGSKFRVRGSKFKVQGSCLEPPAAVGYLSRFLCAGFALALLATGCASPRPLKGIVWVGVGLFVFGLASLVYPPLKVIIGSVTTSAALMLGGVALMVLPSLIVGNEMLILGGVGLAVGAWFLAHRHGQLRGIVAAASGAQNIALPATQENNVLPSSRADGPAAASASPQTRKS